MLAFALASAPLRMVYAADAPVASTTANISENMRVASAAAKREAILVEAALKQDTEKVKIGAKKVAHEVADATKEGAHAVKVAAKDVAAKTKTSIKDATDSHPDGKPAP
jgi:hypothetical protein